ncbi:hypothetical protein ACFLT7_06015 [candidate division KSB1 bacterium]
MKIRLLSIIACSLMLSCGPLYIAGYYAQLIDVEEPGNQRYKPSDLRILKHARGIENTYENSAFDISIELLIDCYFFGLKNKSYQSIRVIWDESFYIDEDSEEHHVVLEGTTPENRFKPQTPSVIERDSTLIDEIYPASYTYYDEDIGWRKRPLLPVISRNPDELERKSETYIGRKIGLILMLEIYDVKHRYEFTFEVKDTWVEQYKKGMFTSPE